MTFVSCKNLKSQKHHHRQAGYTLVEIAIVILIAGVMLGLAALAVLPILETTRRVETEGKMQKIAKAMSQYTVRNNRLPCPANPVPGGAEPFGAERGSGAAGGNIPANCGAVAAAWTGIIPYRTLGLDRDSIIDGWNNYFTYSISPAFSQDTTQQGTLVHAACRTADWYFLVSNDEIVGAPDVRTKAYGHRNPRKARFCCPSLAPYTAATDLDIRNENNQAALTFAREADQALTNAFCPPTAGTDACSGLDCCSAGYDTTARPYSMSPSVPVLPTDRTTAVAYVLVSHGRNGFNAAYNPLTGVRPAAPPNAEEAENASDANRIFRERFEKTDSFNDAQSFDDILYWRTQDLMFADEGESCAVP